MIDPAVLRQQRAVLRHRDEAVLAAVVEARQEEEAAELATDPGCSVCSGPLPERTGRGPRSPVCPGCKAEGYVAARCQGCGGPLKRIDQHGPKGPRRNHCQACRSRMEHATPPTEQLRAAGRRSAELRAAARRQGEMARLCTGMVPVPRSAKYVTPCRETVEGPLEKCRGCQAADHHSEAAA